MSIPRHAASDDYVFEEIRKEYVNSDPQGRILMLQRLYAEGGKLLSRITLLAVADPDAEVRQWLARFGKHLEEQDVNRLKNDLDPYVRACLRENPNVFIDIGFVLDWKEWFEEAKKQR